MSFRETLWWLLLLLVIVATLVVMVPIIFAIWISLYILDIPNKIGKKLDIERFFVTALYWLVDERELTKVRSDYLDAIHSVAEYNKNRSRWGLVREIDLHRNSAIQDLKRGEQFIAIFGGIFTVAVGNLLGYAFGGLVLSLAVLFYTLTVGFRTLVVDSLAFSGRRHRNAPLDELSKMKAWNAGPLRGTGGLGVVLATILSLRGKPGYELGIGFAEWYASIRLDYDDSKWRAESD